jgi:hypothetical protein
MKVGRASSKPGSADWAQLLESSSRRPGQSSSTYPRIWGLMATYFVLSGCLMPLVVVHQDRKANKMYEGWVRGAGGRIKGEPQPHQIPTFHTAEDGDHTGDQ